MIRTIITAKGQLLQITLPADFIGKLIEVIAFPVEESGQSVLTTPILKRKKLTVVHVANRQFKFNRDELHER